MRIGMRLTGLLAGGALLASGPVAGPVAGEAAPAGLVVTISGSDVETFPSYDADLERFAILSGSETAGTVDVTITSDDPAATALLDGAPIEVGATRTVTGLRPGDELNVQVTAAGDTTNQSWIYLPTGFPMLTARGSNPGNGPVFLGLSSFLSETGFETVVDAGGVPIHVRAAEEPNDFTAHEHGPAFTVFEPVKESPDDDEYGYRVLEYDRQYRLRGEQRLRPVPRLGITPDDTDFHDIEYLPDGRTLLVGYHRDFRDDGTPWLDAILQVINARGKEQFTWSSKGHVDPTEGYVHGAKGQDYAHVNSVEMQPNGDLVASFRNTGQVLRIATEARAGVQPGDVIWRLGGERNQFTFVGDPLGGICAQHDARILAHGHLLLFDNGSRRAETGPVAPQTADMCPDPAGGGEPVARPQSRIVEYALDTEAMTATLVWSFAPEGRYAAFAGNAQRLPDGSTLASWSRSETDDGTVPPLASRVTAAGEEVWSLQAQGWFSYRAFSFPAPDRIAPRFDIQFPRPRAHYPEGIRLTPSFTCHDRGGSNLTGCRVAEITGGPPGAAGTHRITFVADDGAGNSVSRRFSYVVDPLRQPDLQVRARDGDWLGSGRWPQTGVVHRADRFGRAGVTRRYPARVVNAGYEGEQYRLTGRPSGGGWSVRYRNGGRDITREMVDGTLAPRLVPGQSWAFTVVVRRTAQAVDGTERLLWVRSRSAVNPTRHDRIAVALRAR